MGQDVTDGIFLWSVWNAAKGKERDQLQYSTVQYSIVQYTILQYTTVHYTTVAPQPNIRVLAFRHTKQSIAGERERDIGERWKGEFDRISRINSVEEESRTRKKTQTLDRVG